MRGFIDLQVNGYRGVDFTSPALTVEDVVRATGELAAVGTAGYVATVVTCAAEVYAHVLPVLAEAMAREECTGRLLGIHLEGPFLSPEAGALGAHPVEHIKTPSIGLLEEFVQLARGKIRMLTVAPERPDALNVINWAVNCGIVVGLGHTLAEGTDIEAAVDAGASFSTHLGNGIPHQINRHFNPLWPQLADPRLTAMLITDGHHVPPNFVRSVLLAKGLDKIIVTSDCMFIAGMEPGDYKALGVRVRLTENGCIRNMKTNYLAGSGATMLECLNTLGTMANLGDEDLRRVGRDNPARLLGIDLSE